MSQPPATPDNASLRIDHLRLINYRCFADLEMTFDPKLTVLVANNGQGKTAVLDAIAASLGLFVGAFDDGKDQAIDVDDIRLIRTGSGNRMELADGGTTIGAAGIVDYRPSKWSRQLKGRKSTTTSVEGVADAGVIASRGGKVQLLKPADYPADWDPAKDNRTPVWEALHQLIRALDQGGESAAGALLARMPERAGHIRQLATWLYTLCEREKWAEDARRYNELVTAWHGIEAASHDAGHTGAQSLLDL